MSNIKVSRKSISLDMTAMCDMAFLLLTFFILTTKFKPQEPVAVDIPSSTAKVVQVDSLMIITLDKEGKVFFGLADQNQRMELIKVADENFTLQLTEEEKKKFSILETAGIPLAQLKEYLNKDGEELLSQPGIPADSIKNELASWVGMAKMVNPKMRIAIKGDRQADYKEAKKVIQTLTSMGYHHISLITNLESAPDIK